MNLLPASHRAPVVIVGGGIVGLATALALRARGTDVVVLEAEPALGAHQTGHNSGVIHSGLYYKPGSLKAVTCGDGRERMYRFCEEHAVPVRRTGKVVVATTPAEVARLDALHERGRLNGLDGLRRLAAGELREIEPHVAGLAALWVPQTGIVDYVAVLHAMRRLLERQGADVRLGHAVREARIEGDRVRVVTARGDVAGRFLVNCAGLQSDRIARRCGLAPTVRIVPFRGEYYLLRPERAHLVRHPIYPVPDPAFPFLGVHFTPRIDGRVEAGPNAVLAWNRHGYRTPSFAAADALATLGWRGFWPLARRHWRTGLAEQWRAWSRARFVASLRTLVPAVGPEDVVRAGCGIRAQAVDRNGGLVDDFLVQEGPRALHVLNAPSPAATASLAIGELVAGRAAAHPGWD